MMREGRTEPRMSGVRALPGACGKQAGKTGPAGPEGCGTLTGPVDLKRRENLGRLTGLGGYVGRTGVRGCEGLAVVMGYGDLAMKECGDSGLTVRGNAGPGVMTRTYGVRSRVTGRRERLTLT